MFGYNEDQSSPENQDISAIKHRHGRCCWSGDNLTLPWGSPGRFLDWFYILLNPTWVTSLVSCLLESVASLQCLCCTSRRAPKQRTQGKVPGRKRYLQYLSNSARPMDPNSAVPTRMAAPLISPGELCSGLAESGSKRPQDCINGAYTTKTIAY